MLYGSVCELMYLNGNEFYTSNATDALTLSSIRLEHPAPFVVKRNDYLMERITQNMPSHKYFNGSKRKLLKQFLWRFL